MALSSQEIFKTPVVYLKGVGPERAALLNKEFNICTFEDLLYYYPFRYDDRTEILSISSLREDQKYAQLLGTVVHIEEVGTGAAKRLSVLLTDGTGTIELVWFKGINWVKKNMEVGKHLLVFGRLNFFRQNISIVHPEFEEIKPGEKPELKKGLHPVYSTTEKANAKGLTSKTIGKLTATLLEKVAPHIEENLPSSLLSSLSLMNRRDALWNIHHPANFALKEKAEERLKFEELFFLQFKLLGVKWRREKEKKGFLFQKVGPLFNEFYNTCLPFQLTEAQKRVIREIRQDTNSGKQMNRLLQGDVGSGKTIVALMAMLLAIDNGYQAALLAPTEILAIQHYHAIRNLLSALPVEMRLLTGSTRSSERRGIYEGILHHQVHILVGTHALLEEEVKFKDLGLVVIDEQHKFGVAQRAKMWEKNTSPPHMLIMSATPIPRTLAMTIYGDLDVSIIDELPPGRKAVKTVARTEDKRPQVYEFIRQQIAAGRQAYIVFPLIEENENLDYKSLEEGYEYLRKIFPDPVYRVEMLHGRMNPAAKEHVMKKFARGEIDILVSTTVIEVGVDVPNASVMVIENAERFGLSQLHQLRGRVGRGGEQSYCILITAQNLSEEARKRIEAMVKTNDGFKIAETDMEIRGPGDIQGTRQSGIIKFKLANIVTDLPLMQLAREKAMEIWQKDPALVLPEHNPMKRWLKKIEQEKTFWADIS